MEWLHFCDFHIGGVRGPQKEVLQSLVEKVATVCGSGSHRISAVFLVGDLAYSGKTGEYTRFTEDFLGPLRLIPSVVGARIFAVPGNHDVDCERCLPISWEGIRKRNQDVFFLEDTSGGRARSSRVPVFEGYRDFVIVNKIISPNPYEQVSLLFADDDLPVNILGTNTAFFSDKGEDSNKPTTPVPLSSLRHLLSATAGKKPLLILGHHSPSSLIPEQERQLTSLLMEKKGCVSAWP